MTRRVSDIIGGKNHLYYYYYYYHYHNYYFYHYYYYYYHYYYYMNTSSLKNFTVLDTVSQENLPHQLPTFLRVLSDVWNALESNTTHYGIYIKLSNRTPATAHSKLSEFFLVFGLSCTVTPLSMVLI